MGDPKNHAQLLPEIMVPETFFASSTIPLSNP